jgi:hypothetical protein
VLGQPAPGAGAAVAAAGRGGVASGGIAATGGARSSLSQHQALLQLARGGAGAQLTPYNFAATSMAYTGAQANATFEKKREKEKDKAAKEGAGGGGGGGGGAARKRR